MLASADESGCRCRRISALLQVNDRLGNLGGMVGDALQVTRGVDQPKPRINPFRIANDLNLELLLDGAVVNVYLAIGRDDGLGT